MNNKIIFILLALYLFVDILKTYTKGDYLWIKIILVISIIIIGLYLKIFKKKK